MCKTFYHRISKIEPLKNVEFRVHDDAQLQPVYHRIKSVLFGYNKLLKTFPLSMKTSIGPLLDRILAVYFG